MANTSFKDTDIKLVLESIHMECNKTVFLRVVIAFGQSQFMTEIKTKSKQETSIDFNYPVKINTRIQYFKGGKPMPQLATLLIKDPLKEAGSAVLDITQFGTQQTLEVNSTKYAGLKLVVSVECLSTVEEGKSDELNSETQIDEESDELQQCITIQNIPVRQSLVPDDFESTRMLNTNMLMKANQLLADQDLAQLEDDHLGEEYGQSEHSIVMFMQENLTTPRSHGDGPQVMPGQLMLSSEKINSLGMSLTKQPGGYLQEFCTPMKKEAIRNSTGDDVNSFGSPQLAKLPMFNADVENEKSTVQQELEQMRLELSRVKLQLKQEQEKL